MACKTLLYIFLLLIINPQFVNAYTILPSELHGWDQYKSTLIAGLYKTNQNKYKTINLKADNHAILNVRLWREQNNSKGLYILIPGTGGSPSSPNANYLANIITHWGYDVIVVTNTFSTEFQNSYSKENKIVGFPQKDIVPAEKMINHAVQWYTEQFGRPTNLGLIGYSLGGTITALYAERNPIAAFSKYIILNPPITFKNAIEEIDSLLKINNAHSADPKKITTTIARANMVMKEEVSDETLQSLEEVLSLSKDENKTIIGGSFQLSLSQITKNLKQGKTFNPFYLLKIAPTINFGDYMSLITDTLIQQNKIPNKTLNNLIEENNLLNILEKIENKKDVYIITSQDDFLLAPNDLDHLSDLLPEKLYVFEAGGHCGEFATKSFAQLLESIVNK